MVETLLTLDYTVTIDEFRTELDRHRRHMRRRWTRPLTAIPLGWIAWTSGQRGQFWFAGFCVLFAVYFVFSDDLFCWWLLRSIERKYTDMNIQVEIDDTSLLYRHETQKYGHRYWWSRLTGVEETASGYESPSTITTLDSGSPSRHSGVTMLTECFATSWLGISDQQ